MKFPRVVNFGCRLNAFESERIESIARSLGLVGCTIVNTCVVTGEAERQVRQQIRKIYKDDPDVKIIVTGCAATNSPDYYKAMPGVVAVIENSKKLQKLQYEPFSTSIKVLPKKVENVRRFIQIQNGCDNFCTYCIVRTTRGKSQSVKKEDILENIRMVLDEQTNGPHHEIVLTGVNISSYCDNGCSLAHLLEYVISKESRLKRVRLSSLDPADITDHFIDVFCSIPEIMPHLHLSIQSGDNLILKRMRRRHCREDIIKISNEVMSRREDTIFGADFITGFPTETEQMYENTKKLIFEANIILTHIFPYSERPGTPAALMPQVDKSVRKARARNLREASDSMLDMKLKSLVGSRIDILAESSTTGKTNSFLQAVSAFQMSVGKIYNVSVLATENGVLRVGV